MFPFNTISENHIFLLCLLNQCLIVFDIAVLVNNSGRKYFKIFRLQSYLSDRFLQVIQASSSSPIYPTLKEVPQGSIFASLLWYG